MILLLCHVLGYDIWFYLSHIALHTRYLYWIHRLHHTKPFPTWRDTNLGHPLESVIQPLGFFVPLFFCEFDWRQTALAAAFTYGRGFLRHDPRPVYLIGNHHLLHHEYFNWNYGEYWLDKLFGTAYPDETKVVRGLLYH